MGKNCFLILANGPWPKISQIKSISSGALHVIACDGALERTLKHGIQVNTVIGDMDSASEESLVMFSEQGGTIIENTDNDSNDLAKAIAFCAELGQNQLIVIGALGGDIAHEWANILTCLASDIEVELIGENTRIKTLLADKYYSIEVGAGKEFSLFAIPFCNRIRLTGCKFELMDEDLAMGSRGVHNIALNKCIEISFAKGALIIINSLD
ncbi:MAG TPA: thiamine diphosphokinase [Candidatus Poseidoniaceae archaeon]|nr:thiamine diphosphokinase [Candidatus Poseidoniaceae archaeon]